MSRQRRKRLQQKIKTTRETEGNQGGYHVTEAEGREFFKEEKSGGELADIVKSSKMSSEHWN